MTQIVEQTSQEAFEAMQREMLLLRAENAKLKANKSTVNGIKISEKGALSVYGLGRFPLTLYRSQWESLFGKVEEIKAFMAANGHLLKSKD